MCRSATPRLVLREKANGESEFVLIEPVEIAKRIGHRVLAAFLKCFVGVDRLLALEHLLSLNSENVEEDSAPFDRNLRVLVLLLAGTMYEIGHALQQLCDAQIVFKMNDRQPWGPVNDLRATWMGDKRLATVRNQLAFHLGDQEVYDTGLEKMLQDAPEELTFERASSMRRHAGDTVLAWTTLFAGVGWQPTEFKDVVALTRDSHMSLPDQLVGVFSEVLRTAGIEVTRDKSGA